MKREIKFRAWDGKRMIMPEKIARLNFEEGNAWALLTWEDEMCFENLTLMQFTGLKDKNGKEIYEGDIINFWLCYGTTQTHTGDNIPSGSYTEPDEPQLVKIRGQIIYNEEEGSFSWSLLGDRPYQMDNAFRFTSENRIPIIGRDAYSQQEIKYILGWDDISDEEYLELIKDYGFENELDLIEEINVFEIIGNIYENPELLSHVFHAE